MSYGLAGIASLVIAGSFAGAQLEFYDDVMIQVENIDHLMQAGVEEVIKITPEAKHFLLGL